MRLRLHRRHRRERTGEAVCLAARAAPTRISVGPQYESFYDYHLESAKPLECGDLAPLSQLWSESFAKCKAEKAVPGHRTPKASPIQSALFAEASSKSANNRAVCSAPCISIEGGGAFRGRERQRSISAASGAGSSRSESITLTRPSCSSLRARKVCSSLPCPAKG